MIAAENLFYEIQKGREHAVRRPKSAASDRRLRRMVEEAQTGGRIIINVGNGYYEPDLSDPVEELEYRHYIMAKKSRIRKMAQTIHEMEMTAEHQMIGQISLYDEKLTEDIYKESLHEFQRLQPEKNVEGEGDNG